MVSTRRGAAAFLAAFVLAALGAAPAALGATTLAPGITYWGGLGTGNGQFQILRQLAVDSAGQVYVTEGGDGPGGGTMANRVQAFSGTGDFVRTWGSTGTADGQFHVPSGVTVDPAGAVFVSDYSNARIEKFLADGTFLSSWSRSAWDIASDAAGNIYAAGGSGSVVELDGSGNVLRSFGNAGVLSVAVSPATGDVYTASSTGPIAEYTATGDFVRSWSLPPSGGVNQANVNDIAVGSDGDVWAADAGGNRILRFSSTGELLASMSLTLPGFTAYPQGIAVKGDLVYIANELGKNNNCCDDPEIFRVDTGIPHAALTVDANPASTGQSVTFDASGSGVNLSTIVRYEWDLDGDGTFERDTGTSSTVTTSYTDVRDVPVSVRVTARSGKTATAETTESIRLSPPQGAVGISVNNGAQFTNDPNVTISAIWPALTRNVLLSNDGGFAAATTLPVQQAIPWRLDSSGPERLPKIVYARFGDSTQTFQDDIILDEVPPSVVGASGSASTATTATAHASATAYRVTVDANDDNSGVDAIQFATDQNAPSAPRSFASTTSFPASARPAFVRVSDRAGNFSGWVSIAYPSPAPGISATLIARKVTVGRPIRVRVIAAKPMTCSAKLIRRRALVRKRSFELDAGSSTVSLPTKRLKPGTYKVRIASGDQVIDLRVRLTARVPSARRR